MANAYTNAGGSGNRTAWIIVTTTANVSSGVVNMLVNGTQVDEFWWGNGQSGRELRFDFGVPRNITEAKWYQSNTATHGDWKWQGSNDAVAWTDIGGFFTLGGTTLQTVTTLAANAGSWRYYRMLQINGTTSSSPYLREIEFNIDNTVSYPLEARLTQIALEQWLTTNPEARMTIVALEQWGSVAGVQTFSARHV
jgi:hypothetical protein